MAILSRKIDTDTPADATAVVLDAPFTAKTTAGLVVPRLSEKAGAMDKLNKYVFTVHGKMNKVELKKIVEKQYGIKIARVNMVSVKGKPRRLGIRTGRTSNYKKAIVTITPDSKKINFVEPS